MKFNKRTVMLPFGVPKVLYLTLDLDTISSYNNYGRKKLKELLDEGDFYALIHQDIQVEDLISAFMKTKLPMIKAGLMQNPNFPTEKLLEILQSTVEEEDSQSLRIIAEKVIKNRLEVQFGTF